MDLLDKKVKQVIEFIQRVYEENDGKLFISFSGGKDSTVLRHIILSVFPDLPVVFSNTTNELIEVIKYVKTFPNVITVTPDMPFKKVVQTYGFPLISKEVSQKVNELKHTNGKKTRLLRHYGNNKGNSKLPTSWEFLAEQEFDITHKCCQKLKKDPLEKWAKKNGNLKPIIALMADESRLRQQLSLYGEDNGKKIYPFLNADWTEEDVWEYARRNNIRFAECYYDRIVNNQLVKARTRTGCEYCMFGIALEKEDRFERSRIVAPKRYENMMNLKNNGITFRTAMNIALGDNTTKLGLYGGIVENMTFNKRFNKEVYQYVIKSETKQCPCCKSRKLKKGYDYVHSFNDTPNPKNNRARVIETYYNSYECLDCNMSFENDLHMFNFRFSVTKRLIDYIYNNLSKKTEMEISVETSVPFETICEISNFFYEKEFEEAKKNNRTTIWFDKDNNLIKE